MNKRMRPWTLSMLLALLAATPVPAPAAAAAPAGPTTKPGQAATIIEEKAPIVADGKLTEALGIETRGGTFAPIIQAGLPAPATEKVTFKTGHDDQESLPLVVYRGTSKQCSENHRIGAYELYNLRKGKKGTVQVRVFFAVRKDGTITLLARDVSTGAAVPIRPFEPKEN